MHQQERAALLIQTALLWHCNNPKVSKDTTQCCIVSQKNHTKHTNMKQRVGHNNYETFQILEIESHDVKKKSKCNKKNVVRLAKRFAEGANHVFVDAK